ncbi:MAG: phosphoenolpyruvate--protein phosphotransferase [Nitrospinae bacterium]|nr:phosphoenolpyruvate--protein phosphotransferase [Nitrospinota bacterium]
MSSLIKGIAASPGIAIGKVFIIEGQFGSVVKQHIDDSLIDDEVERFKEAVSETKEELRDIRDNALKETGFEHIYVLDTHLMILEDKALIHDTINIILEECCNAEWALRSSVLKLSNMFKNMDNDYFKLRKNDIEQVGTKITKHLIGHNIDIFDGLEPGVIIVAHDLSPAETIKIKNKKIGGFVTEVGGKTSHTSIFAMSLGVPAIVGCKGILETIDASDRLIIDGLEGTICINPIPQQFDLYLRKQQREKYKLEKLQKQPIGPAISKDNKNICLYANIETVDDDLEKTISMYGVEGIGLFRTEGIYIEASEMPSDETHFEKYKKLVTTLNGKPAIIRTLDIGGDKLCDFLFMEEESNPALGQRAIRYSLAHPELFRAQLKGILRASAFGEIKIMFPMISHISEIKEAKRILESVKKGLDAERVNYDKNIKIGIMIETPAAALITSSLAKEVDFFSIGTNDLIQYVMAADRNNDLLSDLYQPLHPAVLKLIHLTIQAANKNNIDVGICGEMGGDPMLVALLMGFGKITSISTEPINIPVIKESVRNIDTRDFKIVAEKSLELDSEEKVEKLLKESYKFKSDLFN